MCVYINNYFFPHTKQSAPDTLLPVSPFRSQKVLFLGITHQRGQGCVALSLSIFLFSPIVNELCIHPKVISKDAVVQLNFKLINLT